MSQATGRTFVCPECGKQWGVSEQESSALVRSGCPLCASPVESTDFDE